jgi:hypothetical protein
LLAEITQDEESLVIVNWDAEDLFPAGSDTTGTIRNDDDTANPLSLLLETTPSSPDRAPHRTAESLRAHTRISLVSRSSVKKSIRIKSVVLLL